MFLWTVGIISGLLWLKTRSDRYRFDILALISIGGATMFTVDALFNFYETGVFMDISLESLHLALLITILALSSWLIILIARKSWLHRYGEL